MTEISIMSGLATRGAFDVLLPRIAREAGLQTTVEWNPTTVLMREIADSKRADVVVVTNSAVEELSKDGIVDRGSRVDLAHAILGLAVAHGRAKPAIGTVDDLRRALAGARSVAYSRAGASGIYFESLIEKLGIAETVRARATVIPSGFTAEKLVSGEADLAIQQISELKTVPGVDVIGRLPDELQVRTTFTAAIFAGSVNAAAAAHLLQLLKTGDARDAYVASGLLPA